MSASSEITPQAARAAAIATFAAGALLAQQVAGRAVRDALYLGAFPVSTLPLAMTGAAALSFVAVLIFARLLQRFSPARVLPTAVGASAALLVSEWALAHVAPRAAALAVYVHMAFFGATLVSAFWSLVNESFDPYTAKRVMGRIGAGASLGGVAGGALAYSTARALPAPAILLLMTLMLGLAGYGLRRLRGTRTPGPRPAEDDASALALLRRTPYLRDLALLMAVSALIETLLDYHLSSQAALRYAGSRELAGFFSLFHTLTGVGALLAQTLASRAALERLGLAGSTAVRPALVVAFGALASAVPRLWSAVALRGAEAVARHSLFRSGYELLFTPLPPREKRATKAIVDVGFDRLGTAVGGALAFLIASLGAATAAHALPALAALLALGLLATAVRLHRGYVRALEASLRAGVVELDSTEVHDATTRLTLQRAHEDDDEGTRLWLRGTAGDADTPEARTAAFLAALRARDVRVVRAALATDTARDPRLALHIVPLLARDELALEALAALRRCGARITGLLTDALLDAETPPVARRRVARVLKSCGGRRAALGLLLGLDDPVFEVRRACGQALAQLAVRGEPTPASPASLFAAVEREAATAHAGSGGPTVLRHIFTLLSLGLERESMQLAFLALQAGGTLRGTALEYLETVLPDTLRRALFPLLGVPEVRTAPRRPRDVVREELLAHTRALRERPRE